MDHPVLTSVQDILASHLDRESIARQVAEAIRSALDYRWVGVYDVSDQEVSVIAWSGPGAPAFPRFSVDQGLTGAAVASRRTVIANDVASDPRYLTTLGSTQAEIIVPVIDPATGSVIGTIDAESLRKGAFSEIDRLVLETCAQAIMPLWS